MPGTRKLGRTTDHRLAMLKNLTTSLLLNGTNLKNAIKRQVIKKLGYYTFLRYITY